MTRTAHAGLRRRALAMVGALTALAAAGLPGSARAQRTGGSPSSGWPNRPIRVVVPFAPGGQTDSAMRAIGDRLGERLGQPVVVENRAGGGGSIGTAAVAGARPDGYTFLLTTIVHVVNPLILPNMPFNAATAFAPVTQVTRQPLVLAVRSTLPTGTAAEFLDLARRRPGSVSCGHAGNATAGHLALALLERRAGLQLTIAPYRGGSDAARDLAGHSLDCAVLSPAAVIGPVQGGRARQLALTSPGRSALLPDLPTVAEAGNLPGFGLEEWTGLFAPAGTPEPILVRMQTAVAEILRQPEVAQRLATLGAEPLGSTGAEFAAFLRTNAEEAGRIVREANIQAN